MTTTSGADPARTGLRRPRAIGILAAALLIVGVTYVGSALRPPVVPGAPAGAASSGPVVPGAAPVIDTPGGAGWGTAPGSIARIDKSIKVWSSNLAAEPRDFISATTLGTLYHARGRLSGDLVDQERALAFARTAIEIAPTETGANVLEASILYTLHDFAGALAVATQVHDTNPAELAALAIAADAKIELGRIGAARADYATIASTAAAAGPALDVRLARLAYVTGDLDEAVRLSRGALDATRADAANGAAADLGFYEFAAAEYARLAGDPVAARAGYEAALAIRDKDLGALLGLARIDAFEGRDAAAVEGLRRAAAIAPQPETLALLGDVLSTAGDPQGAARQYETVRFVEQLGEIQSSVFDRVLLRFELDHGPASDALLAKAKASLGTRPDASGHDTVAWALYRLGRFGEATGEIAAAAADGANDARLEFHMGAIALANGDTVTGRAALQRAVALGPALDPLERAEAQRLLAE